MFGKEKKEHRRHMFPPDKPCREEKVLLLQDSDGFWQVYPGKKLVSPLGPVTWLAVGASKLEIKDIDGGLSDISYSNHPIGKVATTTASKTPGRYRYSVKADGQLARGGSSPEVIIDP